MSIVVFCTTAHQLTRTRRASIPAGSKRRGRLRTPDAGQPRIEGAPCVSWYAFRRHRHSQLALTGETPPIFPAWLLQAFARNWEPGRYWPTAGATRRRGSTPLIPTVCVGCSRIFGEQVKRHQGQFDGESTRAYGRDCASWDGMIGRARDGSRAAQVHFVFCASQGSP